MWYFKKVYRIRSIDRQGGILQVVFDDERKMKIPIRAIEPRKGKADWSRISIQRKGGYFSVPLARGDDTEHEVPWDVLRKVGLIEARKKALRRRSSKMSTR